MYNARRSEDTMVVLILMCCSSTNVQLPRSPLLKLYQYKGFGYFLITETEVILNWPLAKFLSPSYSNHHSVFVTHLRSFVNILNLRYLSHHHACSPLVFLHKRDTDQIFSPKLHEHTQKKSNFKSHLSHVLMWSYTRQL